MRVHKWLVRGLVFSALLAMASGVLVYQRWTDPATVRQLVVGALQQRFPGAEVTLESARLRLLGGIELTELRLLRSDDSSRTDFTYVPSAVVYPDKEQFLDGVLAVLKVELRRPRVRIIRERDGRWNIVGLTAPETAAPVAPLPTLVIQEGTLVFEDRLAPTTLPALEVSNVSLTLVNDPLPTVQIEGTGLSASLGRVGLKGTWKRDSGRLALALRLDEAQVDTPLVERLTALIPVTRTACPAKPSDQPAPAPCPLLATGTKGLDLKAIADLTINLGWTPGAARPLSYDVSCRMREGSLRHPGLPLPLDHLQLTARCSNGRLDIDRAAASSDTTKFAGHGHVELPDWMQDLDITLTAENLPVGKDLCQCLPEGVRTLHKLFRPSGPTGAQLELQAEKGQWLRQRCLLKPQGMEVCYALFPYTVGGVNGWLDADLLTNTVKVNLSSTALPVTLTGMWQGGRCPQGDLYLNATGVPLEERLLKALPGGLCALAQSFHPLGRGDLQARFYQAPGAAGFYNTYQVHLRDASICWDQFQYLLEKVTATINIYPDYFEFTDCCGYHNDGVVVISGKTIPWVHDDQPNQARLLLNITGQEISIDSDLRRALKPMPNLGQAWDTMNPSGRLNFHARIDQIPKRPQDLEIALQVHGCRLEPVFFRYPLSDLSGYFRYHHNELQVQNVQAKHGASRLAIGRGTIDLAPQGGFYANLEEVQANPIFPDDGLNDALPPSLQRIFSALNLHDPLVIQTQLIVAKSEEPGSRPDIYWKGRGWLTNAALRAGVNLEHVTATVGCVGRFDGQQLSGVNGNILVSRASLFGQPLNDMHCNLMVRKETPDVLTLALQGPLFGGDVSGQGRLDLNSTLRYELDLTGSQIDLHEFSQQNLKERADLQGRAWARLHLTGQGTSLSTLTGDGTIHVPQGKLYNLPWLLDLLKFLGLRWPDRTAFEEAHAEYAIHGNRVSVNRLDLWGNAISLTGQGEVNLDGSDVKLDFYPSWARLEQLLPDPLRTMSPVVSKNLLKIEVRGKISDRADELKFDKRPVPGLVEPLMGFYDMVTGVPHAAPQVGNGAGPMKE